MTLTNPPVVNDWAARATLDAASLNLYVRDAFTFLQHKPIMRAVQVTSEDLTLSLSGPSWGRVIMDTVREDTYSGFSTSTGYYTAQVPGWYSAEAVAAVAAPLGNDGACGFYLTIDGQSIGPVECGHSTAEFNPWYWQGSIEIYLNAGDSVQPAFWSGGSVDMSTYAGTGDENRSSFSMIWMSE